MVSHLQGATCHDVCQDAGLREGQAGRHGRRRVAEAPGGLIGSPSVSGTEQMSECGKRPISICFQVHFPSPFVCVFRAAVNVCGVCVLFLCVCVLLTFHTLVDTGPSGADCLPYGVS